MPTSSSVSDGVRKNMVWQSNNYERHMVTKRIQNTVRHLQMEGNLALTDGILHACQDPKDKSDSPVLRRVQAMTEVDSGGDDLSSAVGIIGAIGLSIALWCLTGLGIYWHS